MKAVMSPALEKPPRSRSMFGRWMRKPCPGLLKWGWCSLEGTSRSDSVFADQARGPRLGLSEQGRQRGLLVEPQSGLQPVMSPVLKGPSGSDRRLARRMRVLCFRWSASDWWGHPPAQPPSGLDPLMSLVLERPLGSGLLFADQEWEPTLGSSRWNSWARLLVEPGPGLALGPDPMLAGQVRRLCPGSWEPCWRPPVLERLLGTG